MTVTRVGLDAVGERRVCVTGDSVACQRIGSVDLERCRECPYLLRMEIVGTPPVGYVVCADSSLEVEFEFAW